jgi:UDP-N-acetylmuramoyl-L-alanyl-D-glutamate--2,6-diaminopimelate ligase
MKLSGLLQGYVRVDVDTDISGLALDSRKVMPGDAFVAIAGSRQHGLCHARQALEKGAAAIIYETVGATEELLAALPGAVLAGVAGLRHKLGAIGARFFGDPSARLQVIGVTGTNGKTSCSQFLAQALENCGVIGTLGWGVPGQLRPTLNTTPDALSLQAMLADFADQEFHAAAMEVSSHALEQDRVNGVYFCGAVYTNFSRDHLDYHGSMEAYIAAKLTLLQKTGLRFAVVNLDDAYCLRVLSALPHGLKTWGYSRIEECDGGENAAIAAEDMEKLTASAIKHRIDGLEFTARWRGRQVKVSAPVFGDFNVENLLAVLAALLAMGMPLETAAARIAAIRPVPGRMERFTMPDAPVVFVDYAHTPDALDKVLASLKQHCQGKLWVAFGCGGNRDRGKRVQMGAAAERWADRIVLTDDNPRGEYPEHIVRDILAGCRGDNVSVIRDRKQAIEAVINQASTSDCILIAGKGHEDYQEINGMRIPFSDSAVVKAALQTRSRHYAHAT